MELKFFSIDEVKEFVKQLKGTRGKGDKEEGETGNAPAPIQPQIQQGSTTFPSGGAGFAAPGGGATQAGGAFPAAAAPQAAPEVLAIVQRINIKLDAALAAGATLPGPALSWFQSELSRAGIDASQATLDQVKSTFLHKLPMPALDGIAKQMNA